MAEEDQSHRENSLDWRNILIKEEKDLADLDRIGNNGEILQPSEVKVKDEKTDAKVIRSNFLIRPCFVDLHRSVNEKEFSTCGRCKKLNLENSGHRDVQDIQKEKQLLEACTKGLKLNATEDSNFKDNGKGIAKTNAPTVRNMKESEQQIQRERLLAYSIASTSEGRIIKCMFRKITPDKSDSKRRSIRTKKTENKCKKCGKSFTRKGNLRAHLFFHSGEKPYNCSECGKAYTRKDHLKRHIQIHSGAKPYKCDECGEAFRVKRSFNSHLRIHSDKKGYDCIYCGKSFSRNTHLNRHSRIHRRGKP